MSDLFVDVQPPSDAEREIALGDAAREFADSPLGEYFAALLLAECEHVREAIVDADPFDARAGVILRERLKVLAGFSGHLEQLIQIADQRLGASQDEDLVE